MQGEISTKSIATWMGAALIITAVVIGVIRLTDSGSGGVTATSTTPGLVAVSSADWVTGSPAPKAVLIEYSDFQCPACGRYFPIVEQLVRDYSDRLQFVYRHFPLPQHRQAEPAAFAAEAAGRQGKFWEMYRLIFEGQQEWSDKKDAERTFEVYADRLKLDMVKFRQDVSSAEAKSDVRADMTGGVRAGVNATPTFFLNGVKLKNPTSLDEFKALIDAAIAENQ